MSAVALRAEQQARLLGCDTVAQVSLERKMAESVDAVDALSEVLRAKVMPAAKDELAALNAVVAPTHRTAAVMTVEVSFNAGLPSLSLLGAKMSPAVFVLLPPGCKSTDGARGGCCRDVEAL